MCSLYGFEPLFGHRQAHALNRSMILPLFPFQSSLMIGSVHLIQTAFLYNKTRKNYRHTPKKALTDLDTPQKTSSPPEGGLHAQEQKSPIRP